MSKIEILVPELPESVTDATVVTWHKKPGDYIKRNEILVEIETDKVILEVPSASSGILDSILAKEGATVLSKQLLGFIKQIKENTNFIKKEITKTIQQKEKSKLTPGQRRLISENTQTTNNDTDNTKYNNFDQKINHQLKENKIQTNDTKNNIEIKNFRNETRVPMTRIRKRISERLLESKKNTSMLTTFNEVNMKEIINIRKKYGEIFEKKYNTKLGFMSFFVKSVITGLQNFPEINAFIDGSDIIYHEYCDISIAVSTQRGLITPVLRNAEKLKIYEIEEKIRELATKGRNNKLKVDELIGGNFTITNGGIFGSLMSTPIINPPQSAILAMHVIKDRPMVVNEKIEILPMMYLALSYDHCLIDGKESVGFLMKIKETIEDPIRLLLDI